MLFPRNDADHPLARSFRHFLQDPEFPCVGAKSALSRNQIKIVVARDITSGWDDLRIYPALLAFVSWYKRAPGLFRSFAVVFETPAILSEADFERHLWARVQSFSDKDTWLGLPYDERVKAHPEQRTRCRRRLGLPFSSPERGFACGMKFLRAPGWRSPWTEVRSSPSSTRTANRSPTSWPSTGRTPTR